MINRNSFWIAFVAAVLLPFVGYAIILSIYEQMESIGWVSPIGLAGNLGVTYRTCWKFQNSNCCNDCSLLEHYFNTIL